MNECMCSVMKAIVLFMMNINRWASREKQTLRQRQRRRRAEGVKGK